MAGNVLVFNGEIYNFRELRSQLRRPGVRNGPRIPRCCWPLTGPGGGSAPAPPRHVRLRGVHDARQRELFLARDRMGIKPLYFHRATAISCSPASCGPCLASSWCPAPDRVALVDHLRYQTVHAPRTLVEDVRMLMPGQWMRLSDEELTVKDWDHRGRCVQRRPRTRRRGCIVKCGSASPVPWSVACGRRSVRGVPVGGIDLGRGGAHGLGELRTRAHVLRGVLMRAPTGGGFADLVSKRFRTITPHLVAPG